MNPELIDAILEKLLDLIALGIGFLSGVVSSTIFFFLTYRFDWRNCLTREFVVKLKLDQSEVKGGKLVSIKIQYEIRCTNSERFAISQIFLKLPSNVLGNAAHNATLGEKLLRERGFWYLNHEPEEFQFYKHGDYVITNRDVLQMIDSKTMRFLKLGIECSRYGRVYSNREIIHPNLFQKIKLRLRGKSALGLQLDKLTIYGH